MKLETDSRIVLALDAGGTNFVFSAIQGGREVVEPIVLPSSGHDLTKCLATIVEGFEAVKSKVEETPAAISFAFPGPADYPSGVIGTLVNLPAFQGGVALGPMLEDHFHIPVFISNDTAQYYFEQTVNGILLLFPVEFVKENGVWKIQEF